MYATIRRYEGTGADPDALDQTVRQLASALGRAPGFVSFFVLEAEPNVLSIVCLFEDQASLEAAEREAGAALRLVMAGPLTEEPQVTVGEVIFQKGL